MAVGDRVKAAFDIASLDQRGRRKSNAIPQGTSGTVIQEDQAQKVVVVKFDNGVTGVFGAPGSGIADTTDFLTQVAVSTGSLLHQQF